MDRQEVNQEAVEGWEDTESIESCVIGIFTN